MRHKDYYAILGVPRTADKTRIKKAYRRLSKQVHPDKSGTRQGRDQFLDAKEAYDTLTDDTNRQRYDRYLRSQDRPENASDIPVRKTNPVSRRQAGPVHRRAPVEDLIPPDPFFSGRRSAGPGARPSSRAAPEVTKATISLSPAEARHGLTVSLRLSRTSPCPVCAGDFFPASSLCPVCGGRGYHRTENPIRLRIPAGVYHGQTFQIPLHEADLPGQLLELTIRIA